jgi:hypothetical protein
MSVNKNISNSLVVLSVVLLLTLTSISTSASFFRIKKDTNNLYTDIENSENCELFSYCKDKITFTLSFERPIISEIKKQGNYLNKVKIEKLSISDRIGVPKLPVKHINILIPQGKTIESIEIDTAEPIMLGKGYKVELGLLPKIINKKCEKITEPIINFNQECYYPEKKFENIGIQSFRGYSILTLNLYPVQYLYKTGELSYFEKIKITINTKEEFIINSLFRNKPKDISLLSNMIDSKCMDLTKSYVTLDKIEFSRSLVNPLDSYEYVIITNEELKNAKGKYNFHNLTEFKNKSGIKSKIVTVEEINITYTGVDLPDKIRNFVKDAYLNWGIEYILLGGDIDIVPARFLYVQSWPDLMGTWPYYYPRKSNIPSDFYYGCLDGTFNFDGDEYWGETDDGPDGRDIDLRAEVYVGRACCGNEDEVNNFVKKTLFYLQTPENDSYLKNVLMVGEDLLWAWGGNYKDEFINGSNTHGYSTVGIPSEHFNISKLYDLLWENESWPKIEIIKRINSGFNIINHLGHANYNYNMKIDIFEVENLTNDKPCFIYSQGCNSGAFDNTVHNDCAAEYFTVKTDHGAFAGVWNARYGWGRPKSTDGPSQKFDREFFDAIFNEGLRNPKFRCIGVANQDSKEDNIWRINENCMRWCYYELNLFGDPQLSLKPIITPDHDLAIGSIDFIGNMLPNESFEIDTRIVNQGSNDEIDISGNVSIFEIIDLINYKEKLLSTENFSIGFLSADKDFSFNFSISLPRGYYKIFSEVKEIPSENITFNNNLICYVFVGENHPPNKPNRPKSHKLGWREYEYSTSTIDCDGDKIYYKWYWGTDKYAQPIFSDWLGPYSSGEKVYAKPPEGVMSNKAEVIAKDIYGATSAPSDPCNAKPKNIPFKVLNIGELYLQLLSISNLFLKNNFYKYFY